MCNDAARPLVLSSVAATLGGDSDSIHAVSANTTTPHIASMPTARRSRIASCPVIASTRATRSLMNCRAATPRNTIAPTAIDFRNSTRPWLLVKISPQSRRYIWMKPVRIVTASAGVEILAKPRTACTRSSSPGPASTTSCQQDEPAQPHRHGEGVGDAGGVAEQRELAAAAAEAERCNRESRERQRGELRGRIDDTLGAHHHPAGEEHEDHPRQRGDARRRVGEVAPRRRRQRAADALARDLRPRRTRR